MELPRKIQLTGRNTYIVSLPHEWIGRKGISKGKQVYFRENDDGSLTLSLKDSKRELKAVSIEVSKGADSSMRNIVAAYVAGAGTIMLTGQGMSTVAEEARRVLAGVEITDESRESLTLTVLAFEDINIDGIIKRAFNVTHSMFGLSISVFSGQEGDVLTEMSRKEDDVDRLYLLLLRTMCLEGFSSKEAAFKLMAAKSIEKIGDHLLDICSVSGNTGPNRAIADLLSKGSEMYSYAYEVLSSNELDRGVFEEKRGGFIAQFGKADGQVKKEKDVGRMLAMKTVLEKCHKILRYSEDVMESSTDIYFASLESRRAGEGGV